MNRLRLICLDKSRHNLAIFTNSFSLFFFFSWPGYISGFTDYAALEGTNPRAMLTALVSPRLGEDGLLPEVGSQVGDGGVGSLGEVAEGAGGALGRGHAI